MPRGAAIFAYSVRRKHAKEMRLITRMASALLALVSLDGAASAPDVVAVTVHVRTESGSSVPDAYVALIPPWRASRDPVAEQIALRGVARMRVPPGDYYAIGGAPGYSVASRGPVSLTASETDLSIVLAPLERTSGSVRNEHGAPLREAEVSTANAAVIPRLGNLSALAARHLASDFSTTTSADGTWTLPLPSGAVPLLIQHRGSAPEWRIVPERRPDPIQVTLSRGAGLTINTDREDHDLVVTLSSEHSPNPTAIPAARQSLLWARPVTQKALTWDSLPPGSYSVHAKYPAPSYFMRSAVKIGTVHLAAGVHERLRLSLPPKRSPAPKRTAMFIAEMPPSSLANQVQAFGLGSGGGLLRLDHVLEEVIGGTVLHMRLPPDSEPPFFAITDQHFVSVVPPLTEMEGDIGAAPARATMRWRADVDVLFRSLEKELPLPQRGMAWVHGCRGHSEVVVPFEIRTGGAASFAAPAECRGLVLELAPFEPIVSSRVLQRGAQSLGEIVLRAAASADVRVLRDPGGEIVTNATVEIASRGDAADGSPVVVARALTNDAGWAHFPALPPYRELRATAESPDGNRSAAAALRLTPRERGVIDPLAIGESATLIVDVRIDPAFLQRFPSARVSSIEIQPGDPFRAAEKSQKQVSEGELRFEPLAPGEWVVSALVMVTKSTYAPFDLGAAVLKPGETRRVEARVLPNVFEGTVTSDGKPVEAKVMLEGEGYVLGSRSDTTGRFQLVLEKTGVYHVAVARLSAQGNDIPIGSVAFTDPSRPIEIVIPGGATAVVRARVGDRPVRPRTLVMMSRRNDLGLVDRLTSRGRATDAAGEVTFEDLAPGTWAFSVQDTETGSSAEKSVVIEAGKTHQVDLALKESSAIEGAIRDVGGMPLPGAQIECVFIGHSGNFARVAAATDAEGHFSIPLIAPPPALAHCAAIAPNGSVDGFRATPGEPISFTMPAATGTLRLGYGDRSAREEFWLVGSEGRVVPLSAVAVMFAQSRSTVIIPALAAGRWKLVQPRTLQHWLALANGFGGSIPAEAEFTLRTGSTETIQLDEIRAR